MKDNPAYITVLGASSRESDILTFLERLRDQLGLEGPAMDAPDKVSALATTDSTLSSYPAPPSALSRPRQNAPSTVMDLDSHSTEDRTRRAASVLSMDDLEAAQALEGLRSGR